MVFVSGWCDVSHVDLSTLNHPVTLGCDPRTLNHPVTQGCDPRMNSPLVVYDLFYVLLDSVC